MLDATMVDAHKVDDALRRLHDNDAPLGAELDGRLRAASNEMQFSANRLAPEMAAGLTPETIVLRTGRPVLAIRQNQVEIQIQEAESEVWRQRLGEAGARLAAPIRAVGRIEVQGHPSYAWVGTGWLVGPDILVTNRHVAALFTRRDGRGFQFSIGVGARPMAASVDFLEEFGNAASSEFSLSQILHVEEEGGPDLAFFRVAGRLAAQPIVLSERRAQQKELVAVLGYPARDSRIPEQDLMSRLFGDIYDKKRLAPGQISGSYQDGLLHDCTTSGGNSGSAVISLASGSAVALHFAGRFLEANFAVPSDIVAERLDRVLRGAIMRPKADAPQVQAPAAAAAAAAADTVAAFTIPLQVTVRIDPAGVVAAAVPGALSMRRPSGAGGAADVDAGEDGEGGDDGDEVLAEGRPEDYLDRAGYAPGFLGHGVSVDLPEIRRARDDVLHFTDDGHAQETILRYQNFSVVMNRARRMCFYSAVNIDGGQSRKTRRAGWLFDPRIPREFQIKGECYGPPPKFSRGHMTRRQDPAWGDAGAAQRGNTDSMHVTNAVPQMQAFNGGIWLGLEDYALDHAREDDMRICVITGPVFDDADPERYGVTVPLQFWKVIAFIHDRTGALSATGYSISQAPFLRDDEYVFGAYETHQRALEWIERSAGLSFGKLSSHDRYGQREAPAGALRSPEQIQWI